LPVTDPLIASFHFVTLSFSSPAVLAVVDLVSLGPQCVFSPPFPFHPAAHTIVSPTSLSYVPHPSLTSDPADRVSNIQSTMSLTSIPYYYLFNPRPSLAFYLLFRQNTSHRPSRSSSWTVISHRLSSPLMRPGMCEKLTGPLLCPFGTTFYLRQPGRRQSHPHVCGQVVVRFRFAFPPT